MGEVEGFFTENLAISWLKLVHLLGVSRGDFLDIGGFSRRDFGGSMFKVLDFLGLMDFLVDFARPLCFIRLSEPSSFTNSWML